LDWDYFFDAGTAKRNSVVIPPGHKISSDFSRSATFFRGNAESGKISLTVYFLRGQVNRATYLIFDYADF